MAEVVQAGANFGIVKSVVGDKSIVSWFFPKKSESTVQTAMLTRKLSSEQLKKENPAAFQAM